MIVISVLIPIALACSFPAAPTDPPCPQIFKVHGDRPVDRGFNVVFVSDGFTLAELQRYRCAVALLVQGLMQKRPYLDQAELINIYRVDLTTTMSGIPKSGACTADCSRDSLYAPLPWNDEATDCAGLASTDLAGPDHGARCFPSFTPGRDRTVRPLGSETCYDNLCRLVFPNSGKLDSATQWLAGCGLAPQIVVVLENSVLPVAAGKPDVATITLYGMHYAERYQMLAHELGHALLLLDEHTDGPSNAGYFPGRNVARPLDPGFPGSVSWAAQCTARPAHAPQPCEAGLVGPPCHEVRAAACPAPCPLPAPSIGLFQGAFYDKCAYYRSAMECRMRETTSDSCDTCNRYVGELLAEYEALLEELPAEPPPPVEGLRRTDDR